MFYSHQLLARKAPLGQIWMAATMHAKINRRKLDKLNIIKICEEILNPSVPMALRLSGILMGGVVIVYERKVKILYEDVTRLLVEINEAWKLKEAPEPTVIPKGKSLAKKEAVTKKDPKDVGDHEVSHNTSPMRFQQTAFFTMIFLPLQRLDSVDEPYINEKTVEDDPSQNFHQTDAENITLVERFDMYQSNTNTVDRFERFDIEEDEDTQPNFASVDQTQIPDTVRPSSPPQEKYPEGPPDAEVQDQHLERNVIQPAHESKEFRQEEQVARKRKTKTAASLMDYEQTIIPGHIYQSWLKDVSDLISRRGRKRKQRTGAMCTMKIATLMDLPPVVLSERLFTDGSREVYYPAPLLELWMRSIRQPPYSPSERNSGLSPPEPSHSSLPETVNFSDHMDFPFEDHHSGVGSQSFGASMEKIMNRRVTDGIQAKIPLEELGLNIMDNVTGMTERNQVVTPGNSGNGVRSVSSSASVHGELSNNLETNSVRSNKKRHYSSSRRSSGGLEPVAEENPWHHHSDPNFKLASLSENNPDLLVETAPTQTQVTQPAIKHPPADKITDSIRMQMKAHFDTPGAASTESLNNLAAGMNRKAAAMLFYQTCVLASSDYLRVNQQVSFGDIFISKGTKM
ncbi:sister chromatid cohesion 1 protein 1 [Benincasa hispida]|uniref:sister chromatid cohesion 1 protein 1 n=1 Tax=Benincasa hispida TaxID=102211 RepID=UPI0019008E7F|nr:sister chromatid cohesion 1 protein 1 [Benincasa hispida]